MSSIKQFLWIPYAIGATVATLYVSPHEAGGGGTYLDIIIKVFPIVYLIALVESYLEKTQHGDKKKNNGAGVGKKLKENEAFLERRSLGKNVKFALIASAIGDGFMIYNNTKSYFLLGILSFSIAQSFYIRGFGLKHRNHLLGFVIYASMFGLDYVVLPADDPVFFVGLAVYAFLLCTMIWRAIDRSLYKDGRSHVQNQLLIAGAVIFIVSDLAIVFLKMESGETDDGDISVYGQVFILITYFTAQGCVVAGAV